VLKKSVKFNEEKKKGTQIWKYKIAPLQDRKSEEEQKQPKKKFKLSKKEFKVSKMGGVSAEIMSFSYFYVEMEILGGRPVWTGCPQAIKDEID